MFDTTLFLCGFSVTSLLILVVLLRRKMNRLQVERDWLREEVTRTQDDFDNAYWHFRFWWRSYQKAEKDRLAARKASSTLH